MIQSCSNNSPLHHGARGPTRYYPNDEKGNDLLYYRKKLRAANAMFDEMGRYDGHDIATHAYIHNIHTHACTCIHADVWQGSLGAHARGSILEGR